MSLWNKLSSEINYDDVEAFCLTKQREGARLDYKRDFPKELEKIVASFANTLGGVILIGVDADKQSNEPIWPPAGIDFTQGLEERIIQICRDGIYPPLLPSIQVVHLPDDASKAILFLRVDESSEAPHAIQNKTKVYVRTGSVSTPIDLADIQRIAQMLDERKAIESKREAMNRNAFTRNNKLLGRKPRLPLQWASVIPLYPWKQLCEPSICYQLHSGWPDTHYNLQRIPDGSFGIRLHRDNSEELFDLDADRIAAGRKFDGGCGSINVYGHLFVVERIDLMHDENLKMLPIDFAKFCNFFSIFMDFSRRFFSDKQVERPGLMHVSTGIKDIHGLQFEWHTAGLPFRDDELNVELTTTINEMLDSSHRGLGQSYSMLEQSIFQKLAYSVDLPPLTFK